MKQPDKFDLWIDRSIAKLMKITDEMDLANSADSMSEMREAPIFQPLPPHAEASDYLSINDWLEARDDWRSKRHEE